MRPDHTYLILESGAGLVRFDNVYQLFKYDDIETSQGVSAKHHRDNMVQLEGFKDLDNYEGRMNTERYKEDVNRVNNYLNTRFKMTPKKKEILSMAKKELETDKDFLDLIYKAKSEKRRLVKSKHGGSINIPRYSTGSEYVFDKGIKGAKKATLDMAFQVGTFSGQSYSRSFVNILKTILSCQALGISLNIDVFDSDIRGHNNGAGYIICNIANSKKKLNVASILTASDEMFFGYSLFNGYSASGKPYGISGYLSEAQIQEDLGNRYDVIGGNLLESEDNLVSKILKIAGK